MLLFHLKLSSNSYFYHQIGILCFSYKVSNSGSHTHTFPNMPHFPIRHAAANSELFTVPEQKISFHNCYLWTYTSQKILLSTVPAVKISSNVISYRKPLAPPTATNTHRYTKSPIPSSLQAPHVIIFIRHNINQIAFPLDNPTCHTLIQSTTAMATSTIILLSPI